MARIFNAASSFDRLWNTKVLKFNGVYLRDNLLKIKAGAYVTNLDEYESIVTHWIALHVTSNSRRVSYNTVYFDSFGVKHIPRKIRNLIGIENIKTNIYRENKYTIR